MDPTTIASLGIGGPFIAICLIAIKILYADNKAREAKADENQALILAALADYTSTLREFSRVATILLERRWDH